MPTTESPAFASSVAVASPPGPRPITTTSHEFAMAPVKHRCGRVARGVPACNAVLSTPSGPHTPCSESITPRYMGCGRLTHLALEVPGPREAEQPVGDQADADEHDQDHAERLLEHLLQGLVEAAALA